MMANAEVDKFKVWPTQLDRDQFRQVVSAGSREELLARHPLKKRPHTRNKFEERPRMVEAYFYFYDRMEAFFIGTPTTPVLAADAQLAVRLEECFQALKERLQIVEIDLEEGDDAQVIFETLNARGAPLLPADLLRNFLFLRAARSGEPQEELYTEHWARFEDPFWRVEVKQGRLSRPRSDLFLQHFLTSRLLVDVPVKHLFVEYKFWIERKQPFNTVRDEMACLGRQSDDFRRIIAPDKSDPLYGLSTFLDAFDVRTCYPLLLAMLDDGISEDECKAVSRMLESYLLRRAVLGLTTQNYNRVFLGLTRLMRKEGFSAQNLAVQLMTLSGDSVEWPSDEAFTAAWRSTHAYHVLLNPKIVYLLKRLSDTFISNKSELVIVEGPLSVEHLMPQKWVAHWPLPNGCSGLTGTELWVAPQDDPEAMASRQRNQILQTFGNLTIVTQALNSAASNGPWPAKQLELRHSLLSINRMLHDYSIWDETAIIKRSDILLDRVLTLWPRA
jgi:hypothetical protein